MALKKCKECGAKVSTRATACPSCGAPIKAKASAVSTGCGCLIMIVFAIICAGVFWTPDGTSTSKTSTPAPSNAPDQKAQPDGEETAAHETREADATPSFALDGDVTLTLSVAKQPDNRVRLNGNTNLPPGTKLMLSVNEQIENGFLGQSSCFVADDGTFESEAFGPEGGLNDGRYIANVTMPIPALQPAKIKLVIGAKGENLKGPLVEKGSFGVTVSQKTDFAIGENADAAQATRKKEAEAVTAALKRNVCVLLEQLLKFKDEPKFREYGFGTGGPYNKWLKSVERLRDSTPTGRNPIPLLVRTAPGDLLMLGMEYMQKGETDYTRQMLPELKETIGFAEYLALNSNPDSKTDPESKAETEFRMWRDMTGKFSVEATLVERTESNVVLRKKDGTTINVPITKLSTADVEYLDRRR